MNSVIIYACSNGTYLLNRLPNLPLVLASIFLEESIFKKMIVEPV